MRLTDWLAKLALFSGSRVGNSRSASIRLATRGGLRRRLGSNTGHRAAEILEQPALLTTFTVTNHADSGPGSLRAAIEAANDEVVNAGADTIEFEAGLIGTITTSSQLPISSSITISGPGASQLTVRGTGGAATHRIFDVFDASPGPSLQVSERAWRPVLRLTTYGRQVSSDVSASGSRADSTALSVARSSTARHASVSVIEISASSSCHADPSRRC